MIEIRIFIIEILISIIEHLDVYNWIMDTYNEYP